MSEKSRQVDPIPESFASIDEAADFWDTHDFTDYEEYLHEVKDVEINIKRRHRISIAAELIGQLEFTARHQGVSTETLVNMWVKEKLLVSVPQVAVPA